MEIKKGVKFKKFYNENNINNIPYCEIRAVVDNAVIVLFCKKEQSHFYKMIDKHEFEYNIENGIYTTI
jgi:hypothetical protein